MRIAGFPKWGFYDTNCWYYLKAAGQCMPNCCLSYNHDSIPYNIAEPGHACLKKLWYFVKRLIFKEVLTTELPNQTKSEIFHNYFKICQNCCTCFFFGPKWPTLLFQWPIFTHHGLPGGMPWLHFKSGHSSLRMGSFLLLSLTIWDP